METTTGSLAAGRYRLLEPIGTGGTAVVWQAYDSVLHRRVAVKVLGEAVSADPDVVRRLRHEAQAIAQLNHPGVTHVYDFGVEESPTGTLRPYVVMELVTGPTLRQVLADTGPLPEADAATVAGQIAAALAAAHQRGIVHRDITPSNVMLGPDGVKVLDFGIVGLLGEHDGTANPHEFLGTPAYVAPERVLGGEAVVEPAMDVYALGVLWYRMLTGGLPWSVQSRDELLRAHVDLPPAPFPADLGVPADHADLCLRCLAKDPGDRPTAAEIAGHLAGARRPLTVAAGSGGTALTAVTSLLTWAPPRPAARTGVLEAVTPDRSPRPRLRPAVLVLLVLVVLATTAAYLAGTPPMTSLGARTAAGPAPVGPTASGRATAPPTTTAATANPDVGPSAGAPTSAPAPPPPGSPSSPPSSPPTADPGTTYSGTGGAVRMRCDVGTVQILELTPTPGYTGESHRGPGSGPGPVQVVFRSGKQHTDINLLCTLGIPSGSVKEHG